MDVLLLLQVPPVVASDNVAVAPEQMLPAPVIGAGGGTTFTVVVAMHVIIEVPNDTPYTTPLLEPTVATLVLLLVHVPPDVESVNVMDDPKHKAFGPHMALTVFEVTCTLFIICVLYAQPVAAEKPKYPGVLIGNEPLINGVVLPLGYTFTVPPL
jgi:hypothetical protein